VGVINRRVVAAWESREFVRVHFEARQTILSRDLILYSDKTPWYQFSDRSYSRIPDFPVSLFRLARRKSLSTKADGSSREDCRTANRGKSRGDETRIEDDEECKTIALIPTISLLYNTRGHEKKVTKFYPARINMASLRATTRLEASSGQH